MYVNTWCLFMSIQNLEELYYGDTIGRGRGGGKSLNEDDDHNRRMTKQCKNILHPFHLASRCSEKKYIFVQYFVTHPHSLAQSCNWSTEIGQPIGVSCTFVHLRTFSDN